MKQRTIGRGICCLGMLAILGTPLAYAQQPPTASELGSSATLDWLLGRAPENTPVRSGGMGAPSRSGVDVAILQRASTPAGEPTPAFRFRLWPSRTELKASDAQTHFYRALVLYQLALRDQTNEQQQQFNQLFEAKIDALDAEALGPWLKRFEFVLSELERLSDSESFHWDTRLRELQGMDGWNSPLEDVQQARLLAGLLRLKLVHQVANKDFSGAVHTLRNGFRLAAFVGQGETLIQSLVGLAIEAMMVENTLFVIRTPDSPNLYWALRTLPPHLARIQESIEVELEMSMRTFSVLNETEVVLLSDSEITKRLSQTFAEVRSLMSNDDFRTPYEMMVAILAATGSDAKRKLQRSGYDTEKLQQLTDLQASLIVAGRELKTQSDHLLKSSKIPGLMGTRLGSQEADRFEQWLRAKRGTLEEAIARLLFPAISNVNNAVLRETMVRNRLLALEAIRMYAANHQGSLPNSLDEIKDVVVPVDPFSDKPFGYTIERTGDTYTLTLTADVPEFWRDQRVLTLQITSEPSR